MKTGIYEKCLLFAFLFSSILPCSVVQGCEQTMRNTVVYEGNSTSFTKGTTDTGSALWSVAPSSSTFNSINPINPNSDNTVDPKYIASYQVTDTQLKILDATSTGKAPNLDSTAGMYLMKINGESDYCQGAGLTVMISGPNCSYDDSNPNQVYLTCSVIYAGYPYQQIRPVMNWTDSNGATVKSDTPQQQALVEGNPGIQESISKYPISSSDTSSHGCNLTFSEPSSEQPPNIDTKAPSFWAACVTKYVPKTTAAPPTTTAAPTTAAPTTAEPTTTTTTPTTTPTTPTTTTTTSPPLPQSSSSTSISSSAASPSTLSAGQSPSSTASVLTPGPVSASTPSPSVQVPSLPSQPTLVPTTPTPVATGGSSTEGQTLAIVLSLLFGTLLMGAVVCGCWYCCCCPYPPAVAEPTDDRRKRRVRRVHRIMYFWRKVPVEVSYDEAI